MKVVNDPSDTEENIDNLLDLDNCESNDSITGDTDFKVSKAAWEDMQKTMAASQKETKKLNSSLTAIRGELNKLKRPAASPLDKELLPARKKKICTLSNQVENLARGKLLVDFAILTFETILHNWWKNGSRSIPWPKALMADFLTGIGIPGEILESLTLSELAECYPTAS